MRSTGAPTRFGGRDGLCEQPVEQATSCRDRGHRGSDPEGKDVVEAIRTKVCLGTKEGRLCTEGLAPSEEAHDGRLPSKEHFCVSQRQFGVIRVRKHGFGRISLPAWPTATTTRPTAATDDFCGLVEQSRCGRDGTTVDVASGRRTAILWHRL